jgi:adenine-specific DNA glycosylase
MWEFPHGELRGEEGYEAAAVRVAATLAGLTVDIGPELETVRHGVTHHRITMVCFEARHRGGRFRSDFYVRGRWVRPEELHDFPVSVPQRRLARLLLDGSRQRQMF